MKLEKALKEVGIQGRTGFFNVLKDLIEDNDTIQKKIDESLEKDIDKKDERSIVNVFTLLENEFYDHLIKLFQNSTSQLDILSDILIRDGNCLLERDWLRDIYREEIKNLENNIRELNIKLENESDDSRKLKSMKIYRNCLQTAYNNDAEVNEDPKVDSNEQSILNTLSKELGLSLEEMKLINYGIVPLKKIETDESIEKLKNAGVILYKRSDKLIYVPDEIVRLLRKVRGKEIADKYFRRILKILSEPEINKICREYEINWQKREKLEKINDIVENGISLKEVLKNDLFDEKVSLNDRKKYLNNLIEKLLDSNDIISGRTIDEKLENLIEYYNEYESKGEMELTKEGFENMVSSIKKTNEKINKSKSIDINQIIKDEFQLFKGNVLDHNYLSDYNIKPRDVLEALPEEVLKSFCKSNDISTRGNLIKNIFDNYQDAKSKYIANYVNLANRNRDKLRANGILIDVSNYGVKFEETTKLIFKELGFKVNDTLRQNINTKKDKIDILISINEKDVIIIECKSKKDEYNNYSRVTRQIKSYIELVNKKNCNVSKAILIAPNFSDDFILECKSDPDLELVLITAEELIEILESFNDSKTKQFPYKLLNKGSQELESIKNGLSKYK